EPAPSMVNRIRGTNPWPGAAVMTPAGRLLVWRATAVPHASAAPPGTLISSGSCALAVATGEGLLLPLQVQPEHRKAIAWEDLLPAPRLSAAARLQAVSAL